MYVGQTLSKTFLNDLFEYLARRAPQFVCPFCKEVTCDLDQFFAGFLTKLVYKVVSRISGKVPEPTHRLAPCHQLCCGRCFVWALQQFIASIGGKDFPSLCEEEANFPPPLNTVETIPYPLTLVEGAI
jgi:hypothetical protein